jgi:signal transduction histidine kinase
VTVQASSVDGLPVRVESELFRIAQEALTNVRKHAHAQGVEIGLRRRGSGLTLSVGDDGVGFSVHKKRPESHGLIGMRERAKLLGGRLQVSSEPGGGTRILARVPASTDA